MLLSHFLAAVALTAPATSAQETQDPRPVARDAVETPSGLVYTLLAEGPEGAERPRIGDLVRVHYEGRTADGVTFDTSRSPRVEGGPIEPLTVALGEAIEGWNEGLLHCPTGGRIRLVVPPALAYGAAGWPDAGVPADATLEFEIELLEIVRRALPRVSWPSDGAGVVTSESGLAWIVLEPGDGEPLAGTYAVLDFSIHNPAGGFVGASTYSGRTGLPIQGPIIVGLHTPRFRFVTEAISKLSPGARILFRVPPSLGFGRNDAPNLPAGTPSLWHFEVTRALVEERPEFALPEDGALTATPSGLRYAILREGDGILPARTNVVLLHYAGWLADGTPFDASWDRMEPLATPVRGSLPAWTEGLQLVREGGRILLVVPPELAYGNARVGRVPAGATLVFVIDLIAAQ